MRLSGVIIAKNEEEMIADAIDSLSFCDEVIVIDNGSTDRTADLSKRLGATVFGYSSKDFSKLRNLGKEKAQGEWILYVDADERVSPKLSQEIKEVVAKDGQYDFYKIRRKNFYLGEKPWPKIEEMERLFKKSSLIEWYGQLHESPKTEGRGGKLNNFLIHRTHNDLTSMLDKTIEWSDIEAKNRFDSKHPKMTWWRFPKVMIDSFFDYYLKQGGYKLGTAGLIESIYQSFSTFVTYAKLWEMQNKSR